MVETGSLHKKIKVRYLGKDNPLALRHNKIYEAIVGQKGLYCIVDETGEEYGYHPGLFEIIEENE
jgi:hypothetical protein